VRSAFILSLASLLMARASPAPPLTPANQFQCARKLLDRGEYLKAADLFEHAKASEQNSGGPFHQTAEQVMPFVTGYLADIGTSPRRADTDALAQLSRAQLRPAIPEIVDRARRTKIVILNEEHIAPRDRAFALQVARALRPLGYSILAAEAFHSSADPAERKRSAEALRERGHARIDTGFYVRDPVYANFLRQSLALGYRPLIYEYFAPKGTPPGTPDIAVREQGEVDNLMRAIFSNDRTAKVLIYVGYSHAAEAPLNGNEWMAARLKKLTGINPLTIDQTTLSPTGESRLYAALAKRIDRHSVVPMLAGKPLKFGLLASAVDLEVAHPPLHLIRGRPDWLLAMDRRPIEVPRNLRPGTGRVLVQVFLANEGADAVPVDQVVVTAGRKPPPLLVPKGRLRFAVRYGYKAGDCDAVSR
jgi:hypothetical protein